MNASSANTVRRQTRANGLLRGLRRPDTVVGVILVGIIFGAGLLAPLIAPRSPYLQGDAAFLAPGGDHLFGTDEFGRDILSRVLFGIRQDVFVCSIAVPLGAVVGTLLGLISATRPWLDAVVQRSFDVMLAFTSVVLGVTVSAIIGPGLEAVLVTVMIVNIPLFGRLSRNAVKVQQGRDYVVAARVVGASPMRALYRHILRNVLDPLFVQAALSLSLAVFLEGAMSFVGIGVRLPEPSLGSLLRTSTNYLSQAPTYPIAPVVVISALVLGFNLISDGLNKGLLRR